MDKFINLSYNRPQAFNWTDVQMVSFLSMKLLYCHYRHMWLYWQLLPRIRQALWNDIMERAVSISVLFIRSATLFCVGLYSTVVWCTIETRERLLNNIPPHYQSFNFLSSGGGCVTDKLFNRFQYFTLVYEIYCIRTCIWNKHMYTLSSRRWK